MLEVICLGSGNAFSAGGRYCTSFLANGRYLFDAPPTLLAHLKRIGYPLGELEVVFLSHFHADHFIGLPFLFLEYCFMTERDKDLYIVGPPGAQELIEDIAERCFPDRLVDQRCYRRIYLEPKPYRPQVLGEVTFQAMPMKHMGKHPCLGYRVTLGDRTIAYTGDTEYCDEILKLADGADVLITDCTYTDGSGPEHMGIEDIRLLRTSLAPATLLMLTHRDGDPDVSSMNGVVLARDFERYFF